MFLFCTLDDNTRCLENKLSQRKCLYLRKLLTIFLRVQVMGCSVSAGLCQILSRVTDELNRLKRKKKKKNKTLFYQRSLYLNRVHHAHLVVHNLFMKISRLKSKCESGLKQCATWKSGTFRSGTGFTWRVWHRGNRSWCDPESLSFFPLTKTRPLIQG